MASSTDDSNVPKGSALSPRQQMLSSGAGALIVSLFMTPLDVVKIRLQVGIFINRAENVKDKWSKYSFLSLPLKSLRNKEPRLQSSHF